MDDPTRAERQRRWYRNHSEEKQSLNKARYHSLKKAGLCVICGHYPPVPGIVRCETCQKKHHARNEARK